MGAFQLGLRLYLPQLAARDGSKKLLFAVNQVGSVECRKFKAMAVGNRVSGAGFHAISAEDTTVIVDVVHLCIPLGAADPLLCRVLSRFDINAVRRTGSGTQKARHTQSLLNNNEWEISSNLKDL